MRARKGRAKNVPTASKGGYANAKRARRDSSDGSEESSAQPQGLTAPERHPLPMMPWDETLAKIKAVPMSVQVERYKDWMRNGSIHESVCRACFKGPTPDLKRCVTCRLVFHAECVFDYTEHDGRVYCSLCVDRGWDHNPPALTPPASPIPRPSAPPDVVTEPAPPTARPMSIPNLVSRTSNTEATQPSLQRDSRRRVVEHDLILWEHTQKVTGRFAGPAPASVYTPSPAAPQTGDIGNAEDARGSNTETPAAYPNPAYTASPAPQHSDAPREADQELTFIEAPAPKRQRKSRFATLSNEVEASLSVLYRELESVTSLKLQIEELQKQRTQDAQQLKLRDNELALLRRDFAQRKVAEDELNQLRTILSQRISAQGEVEELRARNAALEQQLAESRAETAAAQEMVKTWKGKLAQLLNS
ncbi:hypothetical protein BJY01DRAFT_203475 [Aspergillus pseudoustus]|uniref:Zinc finger PHD-type domain-containing protein n=1 Tax=Aspergillus pseudoustus TaxID=1810923 RepID=A0ABR4KW56_9EURO